MRSLLIPMARFAVGVVLAAFAARAEACPFCSAQALTLTEEIGAAKVALVGTLVKVPESNTQPIDPTAALEPCEFKVDEIIKGADALGGETTVKTIYLGQATKGSKFFMTAIQSEQNKLIWGAPVALPQRGQEYLSKILKLPAKGPERLAFFQNYLMDKDELLARDAYDEIARMPYDDIRKSKHELRHKDLIAWIKDPETTASKRRMFFSLLSVCGTKDDVPMIEKLLRSTDRNDRAGLDSILNCFMALKGEDAMPLVEELFLKDPKVDYTDRYSAIMAIRFQGTEGKAVSRERLIQSLRLNLDHPKVADLVVMDLARWGDWDSMDRLVEMFKKSNDDTIFIREPVINFLRICPKPDAKKHLDELAKLDPVAYQRALSIMELPGKKPDAPKTEASKPEAAKPDAAKPQASKPEGNKANSQKPSAIKPSNSDARKASAWYESPFAIVSVAIALCGARYIVRRNPGRK